MRLAPIVERLKAKGLKRVYGALELAALSSAPAALPAFFVVPEQWSAEPNRMSGVHHQATADQFGVVIMLKGAQLREEQVSEELAELEDQVVDALAGWTHPDAAKACDAAGGRMLSVSGNTLSWMVSFRTGRTIRKVPE